MTKIMNSMEIHYNLKIRLKIEIIQLKLVKVKWIIEHKLLLIRLYKWMKTKKIFNGKDQEVIHFLIWFIKRLMTDLMSLILKIYKMHLKYRI
jgi:hypothetical protein